MREANDRPRVAHLVPALFDAMRGVLGGAERYALELARHMAAVVPTTLVTFGPTDAAEADGPLAIRVIGGPWRVRGQTANPFSLRLFRALAEADIVHCHQQHIVAASAAALYCRATGKGVFVTDMGGGGWDVSGYVSTDPWYHGHLHLSEYSRRVAGHDGRANAHVIWGGVDTDRFSPDRSLPRDRAALFVGRLLPHKGIADLVDAAAADLPVDLIGQPMDATFLRDLERAARGKPVRFIHDADDRRLVEAYRRALCVVLPSVYRDRYGGETRVPELLGQTLLEGMSCGAPGVCTEVASLPEVVEDGVTGFVVPPNDPAALAGRLRWLREHAPDARRMGDAARRRVFERFTWPRVVERCLEAYREPRRRTG
jgi:glycosyltransferase involved in cell wall biosynthesis